MDGLILSMGMFGTLLAIAVVVLWIVLPFAVFGIKDRMDQQISVSKKILKELQAANGKPVEPVKKPVD